MKNTDFGIQFLLEEDGQICFVFESQLPLFGKS